LSNKNTIFVEHFNQQLIQDFLEFSKLEGLKTIYMSSGGGHMQTANIMVNIINESPEDYVIKVTENILSSAWLLIYYANCIVEDISGQLDHYSAYMFHEGEDCGKQKETMSNKSSDTRWAKLWDVLTEKQQKKVTRFKKWGRKGGLLSKFINNDIWLSTDQVKLLLGERFEIKGRRE